MSTAPVAAYCWPHETYFLETCCPACSQGIPPLPRPHAAAVAREDATRVDPFDVDFTYPPGQHPGVGPGHVASCPRRSGANYCWCDA